ncbi:MAG TPA: hypothetical protein VLD17_07400 [Gemmatimonadaceae bacterium]|nr:hypothetical protein [Gemmatimonadaceae bacterium]
MQLSRLLVLGGVAVLGACSLSTDLPTTRPLGVVVLTDTVDADSNTVLFPVAHFFNGTGVVVPNSRNVVDSCVVIPYLADTGSFPYNQFPALNAGDSVIVQTGSVTASLFPVFIGTSQVATGQYDLGTAPPMPFTPGNQVSVTVPGATGSSSFPPVAASAATAAPYTVNPINRNPPVDSFTISWQPAAGTGSAVVFAVQFDTAATATGNPIPIEMYCSDEDTGVLTVPQAVARLWLKALPGPRNLRSYRWQSTVQNNGPAGLIIISQHNEYRADAP